MFIIVYKGIYQLWTHENQAVGLITNGFIQEKVEYIHNNPVKNGLVEKPEDYLYSSARNYSDEKGVLDVILVIFDIKIIR